MKTGMKATWKPYRQHGELDSAEREALPETAFAFPDQRKEPLTNASHVRNALARFDQVEGVNDEDRTLAFTNIRTAARHYGVKVAARSWHDLGRRSATRRHAGSRSTRRSK